MPSIFDQLTLLRQLSFKDGDIRLMGNRVVIIHANFFYDYCMQINDSPEKVSELYSSAKSSFKVGIAESIGKNYGFSFNDFFNWMTKIAILAGWGNIKWEGLEEGDGIGKISVENSPIAEHLKGKVKSPVDHLIRGFIAGGASASLQKDIDALEEECVATGAPHCSFTFRPAGQFKISYETKRQLGLK